MASFIRSCLSGKPVQAACLALLCFAGAAQAQPREAVAKDMRNCQFLSRVSGDSGYGKNNGWQALAKLQALRRAERMGASDVVWERFTPVGAFNGEAEARAYRCANATRQADAAAGASAGAGSAE